ncbi:MAG: hypothetical protein H0U60_18580 [Blastocatellia bacterium]|nr:hypothetical protein [Blastocatellia bacterium]
MEKTHYKLKVTMTEPLLGTQTVKDVAIEYLQSKARDLGIDVSDEQETLPEMLERGTTVFHKLDDKPIYYDYHVRGFLKESGRLQNGARGVKNLRNKIDNMVFIRPRRIALHVPSDATVEYLERPLRAETAQGPRVALARSEMLPLGTWFECEVEVLGSTIGEDLLRDLLDYGAYKGMGQWRNASYGRFTYELEKA